MNTPNPLLPQGALPPRGRSSLYFKILMIFAVHIVVLGGILMVGCNPSNRAKTDPNLDVARSDALPATPPDVTPAPAPIAPPAPDASLPGGNTPSLPAPSLPATVGTVPPSTVPPAVPAATGGSIYVIAAGDTLGAIAKKNGVSVKAIQDANPGIDAKKLQIKAKLQIPAGTASSGATAAGADSTAAASGDATVYIVKSGDVLMKIAKEHNTSVKAIEALNSMKTSAIKAGQKLKVPVMKMASAETLSTPAPTTTAPVSAPAMPAPVRSY